MLGLIVEQKIAAKYLLSKSYFDGLQFFQKKSCYIRFLNEIPTTNFLKLQDKSVLFPATFVSSLNATLLFQSDI